MSVKLQELMVKISTLPEIYQRVLFSADGNGDFYDQVADDESSIFSSWFQLESPGGMIILTN